ncbi:MULTISPECIES: methylglyoxal synthase [Clostridium]|jgi:methylglyoxal synthase|uniref:Methylglyoxal synthase n=2 Tax=root TaxID=1 RepID=R9CFN2_9CLOT|nr:MULTISPECIES: methylglyoxal synthase [Clostridium]EOR28159.1 methylglyoxal synthase [Clostridium sartagoforme AAU1]KLE15822.1 methylglyoxal synthase [Clostridium sp. C8]
MGDYIMGKAKKIALIAHDNRKSALIEWAEENKEMLSKHILCGTGTTASLISEKTGLKVQGFKSGPMGGDQQIGAAIVNGEIDLMVFFWDPLTSQPHDPDVKALLRIAVLYDVAIAMSKSTADFLLSSNKFNEEYERNMIDYYGRIRKDNF